MKYSFTIALIAMLLIGCRLETKRLDQYEMHGIDVSHHQSIIDWDIVSKENVQFAFVKALRRGGLSR